MPETEGAAGAPLLAVSCQAPADLTTILKAIQDSKEAVESKVVRLRIDLFLMQQDLHKVAERVTESETQISTAENELVTPKHLVSKLISTTAEQKKREKKGKRAEDTENRPRRSNFLDFLRWWRPVGLYLGPDGPTVSLLCGGVGAHALTQRPQPDLPLNWLYLIYVFLCGDRCLEEGADFVEKDLQAFFKINHGSVSSARTLWATSKPALKGLLKGYGRKKEERQTVPVVEI
ncbi:hypothetical protein NDU88_005850 [Pleurodeles waltl]|uniref:Uncharacterized protein n=1 Tax=Pleurodeles waltl TaxID=8319 RepID=A0AAV7NNN1_PLEWA|nr:hypothetical protein NDU88_005850 [Pleurodeles waltl]